MLFRSGGYIRIMDGLGANLDIMCTFIYYLRIYIKKLVSTTTFVKKSRPLRSPLFTVAVKGYMLATACFPVFDHLTLAPRHRVIFSVRIAVNIYFC